MRRELSSHSRSRATLASNFLYAARPRGGGGSAAAEGSSSIKRSSSEGVINKSASMRFRALSRFVMAHLAAHGFQAEEIHKTPDSARVRQCLKRVYTAKLRIQLAG